MSKHDEEKVDEFIGEFLSIIAKSSNNLMIKSAERCYKLTNKLHSLIDEKRIRDDDYCEKVYNFSEQLNELVDDFIKENK